MELENYFDYLPTGDIRIHGTRIGIETVLEDYLDGASPEEIAVRYRSLALDQVYAVLLYYLRNQETMDTYLAAGRAEADQTYQEHQRNPPPVTKRLRYLKEQKMRLERVRAAA
jgi:uncharacterized protein (DUF433 family)